MLRIATVICVLCSVPIHASAESGVPEWNESWRWCKLLNQCVPVQDECKNWIGINPHFEEKAKHYFEYAAPFAECAEVFLLPPPKATCNVRQRKCEVHYEQ
jgi:hypothetical protein